MPSITINGKECQFEGKKMILQVALENNVEIPHYCYHPGLSIVASCRICLAEVFAPNPKDDNKLGPWPPGPGTKLTPTCQSPAIPGMVVHTQSPKAIANQKAVMEYLLLNHPLDCPVCDQAGECHLQDYSYRYGRGESRFEEEKVKNPTKDIGPHVKLYSDRCIMCTRCVRFTREVSGTSELSVFGRGSTEEIDIFPGRALDNELSANVVDICPVGALLDKDFLFSQRVWFLRESASIDGITASGDNIWIHHNEGQVYRIKPRSNMDVNKWWISDEIRYGWKFIHSEDRLRRPMRQQVGSQAPCDWQRAYDTARDGLKGAVRKSGQGSLALLLSPMLPCEEAYLLAKFARDLDPQAVIGMGPVPVSGEDKTFPGGYTVYAEKCPNRRGIQRVAASLGIELLNYESFITTLSDKETAFGAVVVTGNYPSEWTSKELAGALKGKFVVLLDTLPTSISEKVDVLLPSATWAEKAGTFENANNRLQAFEPAIAPLELVKPEGQIAIDLAAACGVSSPGRYAAAAVRQAMGSAFVDEVHTPSKAMAAEPTMQYVEL